MKVALASRHKRKLKVVEDLWMGKGWEAERCRGLGFGQIGRLRVNK
jgi:hypothetical protein